VKLWESLLLKDTLLLKQTNFVTLSRREQYSLRLFPYFIIMTKGELNGNFQSTF